MNEAIRILIVEDDIMSAATMADELKELGYESLIHAYTYEEGFGKLEESFDLILMDINIPGAGDGIDLAEAFKKKKSLPIIFLTAEEGEETLARAKACRPSGYMLKPINYRVLSTNIELALDHFSQQLNPSSKEPVQKSKPGRILSWDNNLFIKSDNRYEKLALDQILWVQADNAYVHIHTQASKHTMVMSLKYLEESLPSDSLQRINRSQLVNLKHIDALEVQRLFIGKQEFKISEAHRQALFTRLGG